MCAIAGILNLGYDESTIQRMLRTMRRRGPDSNGAAMYPQCCLLHARLAIIDPEHGLQPMQLQWQGKTYTLIYNGELYNTEEIRKELVKQGHFFETHSDTEVVLHAFAQWKEDCLHQFNGIYAFAVWERETKSLFLARDRMGVKPLFYKEHKGGLLFASEIKSILEYPGVERKLDAEGIGEILLLGPGKTPGSGILRGIRELEPGCCAWFQNGHLQIHRYWYLKDREHTESLEETAEHVRWLVADAIRRQMVSDVPVGTFLSGGLDSSLITAICAENMQSKGEPLPTFSLDFRDNDKFFVPEKFQPSSDNHYIRQMQRTLHTEHHWTVLTPEDMLASLEEATIARDLPGMADVDFSLLAFCSEISAHVKVALSGECADEIFGGYPWFRDPNILASRGFPWAQNTQYRAAFLHSDIRLDADDFVNSRYETAISQMDILPENTVRDRQTKQMVNLNYCWFMQTLLDRKDRMSMYNSLEVRVPFCDHRIAEYLYGVPCSFKDHGGVEKGLLRYAMEGVLPKEVLWRKKSPYPKTHDPKYLALVSGELRKLLQDKNAPILQIIRKDKLEELLHAEFSWPWYGQLMKVPQTIAYMLQINFWLAYYHIEIV